MPYTTQTKILVSIPENVLASLLDDVTTPPTLSSAPAQAVLAQLMSDADRWVDSHIAGVLALPLTDEAIIEDIETCARIHVIFNAYGRRGRYDVNPFTDQYKAAERWLKSLRAGDVMLTDSAHREVKSSRVHVAYQSLDEGGTQQSRFNLRTTAWGRF